MNADVEITKIDKIIPHKNADKLEIACIGGWKSIVSKGEYKENDSIVFIHPDAQIFVIEGTWTDKISRYLGKEGRVLTVKLRNVFSEGIVLHLEEMQTLVPELKDLKADTKENECQILSKILKIKHYEPKLPIDSAVMCRQGVNPTELPYHLPKTDQENIQSVLREDILNKTFYVTRKMDGSSCTITVDNKGFIQLCSRKMNLALDHDNCWTRATQTILKYITDNPETYTSLPNDSVLVLRGEVCGAGVNSSRINKDCTGYPTFHLFEAFVLNTQNNEKTTINIFKPNEKSIISPFFFLLNPVSVIEPITITEENVENLIESYLEKPASDGEGVVFWEVKENKITGFSFKIRSKEYDTYIK